MDQWIGFDRMARTESNFVCHRARPSVLPRG
jgi:hypothetical protein